ncbi:MAG TPA: hypothetical protein VGF99_07725 [Myxococcota bacterium]
MPGTASAFDTLMANRRDRVAAIADRKVTTPLFHPRLDTSNWPIVVGTMDDEVDIPDFLDAVTGLHLRGPFALVIDMRELTRLESTARHVIAAARVADAARFPDVRRATAYICATEAQRRALLPLAWMSKVPYPEEQFARYDDATIWAGIVSRLQ